MPMKALASPERLERLIEALPVGVFILDASGNAVYANPMAQALLGRGILAGAHAQNLGERYDAYVAGTNERYPMDRMPVVRALAGERAMVDDMEIERNGERVALEVTGTPIVDADGRIVFAVAVFQDITARRAWNEELERQVAMRTAELEQAKAAAERASRAKSVFLMNVSHELRTPLHHTIGFTELLGERIDDPRQRALAGTASASARALLEKLDQLIELARAEAEPVSYVHAAFDFDALMEEASRDAGARCEIAERVGTVYGDRQLVRSVVSDVLHGSDAPAVFAYAAPGGVIVSIPSPRLRARVHALAHLFGETAPPPETRYHQREIDLRLAVARARARSFGGDLTADTESVHLQLPLTRS